MLSLGLLAVVRCDLPEEHVAPNVVAVIKLVAVVFRIVVAVIQSGVFA